MNIVVNFYNVSSNEKVKHWTLPNHEMDSKYLTSGTAQPYSQDSWEHVCKNPEFKKQFRRKLEASDQSHCRSQFRRWRRPSGSLSRQSQGIFFLSPKNTLWSFSSTPPILRQGGKQSPPILAQKETVPLHTRRERKTVPPSLAQKRNSPPSHQEREENRSPLPGAKRDVSPLTPKPEQNSPP